MIKYLLLIGLVACSSNPKIRSTRNCHTVKREMLQESCQMIQNTREHLRLNGRSL